MTDTAASKPSTRTASPRAAGNGPIGAKEILRVVLISLAVIHAAQVFFGDYPMAAVVVYGAVGAWWVGWQTRVLRSVRTAVVLLAMLSVSCILATLTVQRSQLTGASDEEFQRTVAFAWAHLLVKVTHPLPGDIEPQPELEQQLATTAAVFGEDYGADEREKAMGALASQRDEARAQQLAHAHPAPFAAGYRIADAMGFTDAFRAWWFTALFYMLCANLLFGALMRRPVSVRNLGFHGAHLGLVFVVAGATGGAFMGQRGFVPLTVGETADTFVDGTTRADLPLGFSVRLDDFETLYHEDLSLEVGSAAESPASNPHHGMMGVGATGPLMSRTVKLERGTEVSVTDPVTGRTHHVSIEEIDEAIGLERTYVAAQSGGDAPPAVRLAFGADDPDGRWLTGDDGVYIDPQNRFKLRLDPAGTDAEVACGSGDGLGTFSLTPGDGAAAVVVPAVVGTTFDAGDLHATVLEVTPDFRVGQEPAPKTAFPRNPAARVAIGNGTLGIQPYLFFADPALKEFTQLPWPEASGTFEFDYWCASTGGRVEIVPDDRGGATAVVAPEEGEPERHVLRAGDALTLPWASLVLTVLEVLPAARSEARVVREMPGADEADAPRHTALRVNVDGDEHWMLSNHAAGLLALGEAGSGAGVALRLADNPARPPRDWRSHLSILEEGRVAHAGVAEVNQPLCYGGYCFFQSDADPDRPTYSGMQVVRDPAWAPVKGGLWLLLLGISWCFYVQPLFDRRRGGRRTTSTEGDER